MPETNSETRFQRLHETGHVVVAHALDYSVDAIIFTGQEATGKRYVSFRNPQSALTQPEGPLKYLNDVARVILPEAFGRRFRKDLPAFDGELVFLDWEH